jgi:hypothetical protein
VAVIPGCFSFAKMCFLGIYTLFIWAGEHVSLLCSECDVDPLAFILHIVNQFCNANRLVCSFCEAMAGSLSVATTATSSAKFAAVDSGEVGRCIAYGRYNNNPRILPGVHSHQLGRVLCTQFQPL